MRSRLPLALAAGLLLPALGLAAAPAGDAGAASDGWQLVWADEFDGAGPDLDRTKWVLEEGGHGWGNEELQFYRDDRANARVEDGALVITARRERFGRGDVTRDFTSARLKTQGVFEQAYGRFEARILLPRGRGIWPAFWMLGGDIADVGWPECGEIDVMEHIGSEPGRVFGTVHGPGYSGAAGVSAHHDLPGGAAFADGFHLFAVEWEPRAIRWYVDGELYRTVTPADLPAGARWAFDHPFFLLLNVAVGGRWPGSPDQSTTFPQRMRVDFVRVYRAAAPPPAEPAEATAGG